MTRKAAAPRAPSLLAPVWLALLMIALLFGGVGAWSISTEIAGAVIAPGRLKTREAPHELSHPNGGLVQTVIARDGQFVSAGDALLQLDPTLVEAELAMVSELLSDHLVRKARLTAERAGTADMHMTPDIKARLTDLPHIDTLWAEQQSLLTDRMEQRDRQLAQEDQRLLQIDEQLKGVAASIASLELEVALARDDLTRHQTLEARGIRASAKRAEAAAKHHNLLGTLQAQKARKAELLEHRIEVEIGRISLAKTLRIEAQEELDKVFSEISRLRAKRTKLLLEHRQLVLRAPIAGFVHDLRVRGSGAVARSGQPILTIIPKTRDLQAVARVSASDIDQIYRSQECGIRFLAFNSRTQPLLTGKIESIAAEASIDPLTRRSYFDVYITIPRTELANLPAGETITNGMEVSAFIQTQKETPFYYVTKPIRDYLDLAFRDRS